MQANICSAYLLEILFSHPFFSPKYWKALITIAGTDEQSVWNDIKPILRSEVLCMFVINILINVIKMCWQGEQLLIYEA